MKSYKNNGQQKNLKSTENSQQKNAKNLNNTQLQNTGMNKQNTQYQPMQKKAEGGKVYEGNLYQKVNEQKNNRNNQNNYKTQNNNKKTGMR
ncbi:MAG TPA: hypothetical protein VLG50_06945 [Candidatus Saccharimonadales bacterium]|nr:hypothetical protein [Candidatus Saccharimonadales bacterium]